MKATKIVKQIRQVNKIYRERQDNIWDALNKGEYDYHYALRRSDDLGKEHIAAIEDILRK